MAGLRIDVISQLDYPVAEPFPGGAQHHTYSLVRALRHRGHRVRLFAAEGSDPHLGAVCVGPATGPISRIPGRKASEAAALAQFEAQGRIIDMLRRDPPDIIHNDSRHELPVMLAHELAAPMLTALHAPPCPVLDQAVAERQWPEMPFVALSGTVARAWEGRLGAVPVLPGGIDLEVFQPALLRPSGTHALWCGPVGPGQGVLMALQAALIAGLPLLIAGPITDLGFWNDRIRPRLRNGSRHLGQLDPRGLALAMSAAAVVVCTDRPSDAYGLSAARALACGTPVAGFAQGPLPSLVNEVSGRLAPPGDVAALARSIQGAAVLRRMDCRRRAEQVCDIRLRAGQYEAAYRTAITRHRTPAA
ncbi:glycosyltransferase [Pseudoroseomonas globiformis]|uniref:Glycosyltransferase n=1 Tax=Teichococcus globiformis TaxID=2307229 RepID=A0ABV7FYV7_9PROT